MTTPNLLPLWQVMRDAYDKAPMPPVAFRNCDDIGRHFMAAEIRALRDWLVPEEDLDLRPPTDGGLIAGVEWCVGKERQRLRALLTTEADRAERGDHG